MKYDVFGIGNALVDKEFEVTEDFLAANGIQKGMMTLIDQAKQQQLLAGLTETFGMKKRASGGSAANSIVAVSQFGGKTFYACKVANDETGEFYMHDLHAAGVATKLDQVRSTTEGVTGKCMVMVTPDAERTMNTFLGITADFSEAELHLDELKQAQYLYIEGYLVTSDLSRAAVLKAREVAMEHGVKTAMTFSDPAMVTYFGDGVRQMLGDGVDILFCNREEACTFTGKSDLEEALAAIKPYAGKLVITLGSKGALVVDETGRTEIAAHPVKAIDTNGAGDMFAGAFLYGVTQGMDNARAGKLASLAASRIVTVFGARLSNDAHREVLAAV
ncbi:adenosine kinase [Thiothrix nivea]|uniref:PfkB domain protein n=1 Tax=Thiothrix nivea (strain ATCC 35100 / DSM 5205 / JP2) TaxID=870187 RepID=A0A656HII4_THINJ|nr:adenosine kinase [Thiothrix nivea]EIJ35029.1 PfkB domain protein [Thiothrix nivea DSM 5205]